MPFTQAFSALNCGICGSGNERRSEAAAHYRKLFAEAVCLNWRPTRQNARGIYHLYVIRVNGREASMQQMAEAGIGTAIHYPVPLHLQKANEGLGCKAGDFPVAEVLAREIVSLPMFPQLTEEQQNRVVESVSAL